MINIWNWCKRAENLFFLVIVGICLILASRAYNVWGIVAILLGHGHYKLCRKKTLFSRLKIRKLKMATLKVRRHSDFSRVTNICRRVFLMKPAILRWLLMDTTMHLVRSRTCTRLALGMIFKFLFLGSCSGQSEVRNTISFRDSVILVQDSLKAMTLYLDRIKDADVKNFFFDNENWFYINNSRVARMATGDNIDFLPAVQEITGLSQTDSYQFISLALFLKNNHISGCFKHYYFECIFVIIGLPRKITMKINDTSYSSINRWEI